MKYANVRCIPIDNGSMADVLYHDTLLKKGISLDQLIEVDSSLVGFMGDALLVS